jgi:hypothetical protein
MNNVKKAKNEPVDNFCYEGARGMALGANEIRG